MANESYFLAFGGLGLSLAGFAGLISTLTRRPAANPVLAAYRTRTIVFLGFSLTFVGFGTVAAFGLLGPDVQPAVRVGTLVMLVSFLRGILIDTRPGPIWPDERERWGSIAVLVVMAAVTLGNLAVASVGYLQVVMMLGLIGPVMIFYNTIRDASLAAVEVDDPQRPKADAA